MGDTLCVSSASSLPIARQPVRLYHFVCSARQANASPDEIMMLDLPLWNGGGEGSKQLVSLSLPFANKRVTHAATRAVDLAFPWLMNPIIYCYKLQGSGFLELCIIQ
jgi:hypothetical protein